MNTAYIMLGSNSEPENNIETAKSKILEFYEILAESTLVTTKPHGKTYKNNFFNQAIKILSDDILDNTKSHMKQIETSMGRTSKSKAEGLIPIDIDIVIWNDNIVHRDYDRFDFVRKCIDEISN